MRGKLLFVCSGAFALGILAGTFTHVPAAFLVLGLFLGLLCCWLSFVKPSMLAIICGIALLAGTCGIARAQAVSQKIPEVFAPLLNQKVVLSGTIVADPDIRQKNQQLIMSVREGGEQTRVLVFAPLLHGFAFGERITSRGTLAAPTPFATEGGRVFRYDHFLAKKGVFSVMQYAKVSFLAPPANKVDVLVGMLFEVKHAFVDGLSRALPDPYAPLAVGLLTGDQHGLSSSVSNALALSGLVWVVVLAGYHVTVIAESILVMCSFLPRRWALLIAGLSVALIVFVTGASAPSLRGGVMACFTLLARGVGRTYDSLRALALTLMFILLWNPLLLAYDFGFQLSLVVTPAIIIATPILELRLVWIKSSLVREVIVVSSVAQLACVPLILWQTGQVGVWAIPANMLVMPLVPISMFFTVIAGIIGMIVPTIAPLIGLPAYALLYYLLGVAKAAAQLPLANLLVPTFPFVGVVLMYGILMYGVWWLKAHPDESLDSHKQIRKRDT